MAYFRRYLPAENKGYFRRFGVADENCKTFGGNDVAAKKYFISGGYFRRNRQNFHSHQKYY
jgi:hypothetical protein